jgi:asparaginyl-tRNA synthetase
VWTREAYAQSIEERDVAEVVQISHLREHVGEQVTIQGWLYNKTGKGKLQFLQVRDGTGICQAVVFKGNVTEEEFEDGKRLTQESSLIRCTGRLRSGRVGAGGGADCR